MRFKARVLAGAGILALFCLGSRASAQATTDKGAITIQTINVTGARPVAKALDAIEERYAVLIDYVDPQYAAPQDLQVVRFVRGTPVKRPYPIPRVQTITLQYRQVSEGPRDIPYISCNAETMGCAPVNAWPQGGITALIRQVLNQFADQGGQTFLVRKLEMPYGPRWEVYPEEARDNSGKLSYQPDVLAANIYVPKQKRPVGSLLGAICHELTLRWGHKFGPAAEPANAFMAYGGQPGVDNKTARRVLADLMGPTLVLRLFYAPDDGMYYVNIANLPYREPPRPPTPAATPAKILPPSSGPPAAWLDASHSPNGISEIQGALAKAGYLHASPTTSWDANAIDALRRFQAANGLRPTGEFDLATAFKIYPFLPKFSQIVPAKPAMDVALQYWLESTRSGHMEIQEALEKAGFAKRPVTVLWSPEDLASAIKAFQTANGLAPNGHLDGQTADKLAPLLPKHN